MVILFNLLEENIFSKYNITPEQLFIIEIFNADKDKLESCLKSFKNSELLLQNLIRRGFISDNELTVKGAEVINSLSLVINSLKETDPIIIDSYDEFFKDFWNLYPYKVPNRFGQFRVLRSKDTNSLSAKKVKQDIFKLLKKGEKRENIIIGLKNQISISGNCEYFQNIETWVNQRTYEKYIDIENNEEARYERG